MRAQQAGADAVIVANNIPGYPLVSMVAVSSDSSSQVSIPSVFISQAVAGLIRGALANTTIPCVQVSLRAPLGRLPLLVDGVPQAGTLAPDSSKTYGLWTSPGHDTLSITLVAEFGNPDLFVSSDGRPPSQRYYTWSSRDTGSDTITIGAHDPAACTLCLYQVLVVATNGPARYSVVTQVGQTLRTLQAEVPLGGQVVNEGEYVSYRFVRARCAERGL